MESRTTEWWNWPTPTRRAVLDKIKFYPLDKQLVTRRRKKKSPRRRWWWFYRCIFFSDWLGKRDPERGLTSGRTEHTLNLQIGDVWRNDQSKKLQFGYFYFVTTNPSTEGMKTSTMTYWGTTINRFIFSTLLVTWNVWIYKFVLLKVQLFGIRTMIGLIAF